MAEKEKEAGKKGSKLPVIAVVALVLAAGGFFMMKGKGEKKKGKKVIELGEPVTLKEILVNLNDGQTYLKTEVGLQGTKAVTKEEIEKNSVIINDAIILCLKSKGLNDFKDLDSLRKLKRELAADINKVMPKNPEEEGDDSTSKDDEVSKAEDIPDDYPYDSKSGPIMKVYFSSFATQ